MQGRDGTQRGEVVDRALRALDPGGDRSGSVVLRGPAGIGKTHLANEIVERLRRDGVAIRRITGGDAQRRLAFGALLHLVPADSGPVTVEFELVQRLRAALTEQGSTSVLVVDDVGLLDERTAGLIESVVLQGDAVLLATERTELSGRPFDHDLSALLRSHATPIEVGPLPPDRLAALLTEWAGPGEVGSVRRLVEMSLGNPLVLRELWTAAEATGAARSHGGLWHLDDFHPSGHSLERLVEDHLDRLGESDWELLRCLAVAGTLPRRVAARIDQESLERLERDELVVGDPVSVRHRLYSEIVLAPLSREEVRRVCSKLVATVGPDDEVDAARLGSWLLRAEHDVDDDVARRGATQALARWENRLALRLLDSIASPTVDDLVQRIWALANAGELERAAEAAELAVERAVTDEERVSAGLARAELWALQMNRRLDAYEEFSRLRASVDDPRLIARIAGATVLCSRMTGNRRLAEQTLAAVVRDARPPGTTTSGREVDSTTDGPVVERDGATVGASHDLRTTPDDDDTFELSLAIGDAFAKVFAGEFDAAGPTIDTGLAVAEARGERHSWVRLRVADALRAAMSGEIDRSRRIVDDELELADLAGVRPAHVVWLGLAGHLAQVRGDYELAEGRAREAVRAGERVDDLGAAGFVRGDLTALMVEFGRPPLEDPRSSPIGLARALVRQAPADEADDLAADLALSTAESGYVMWAPWVAWEATRRGAAPRCADLLDGWVDDVDGVVVEAFARHARGCVDVDGEVVASAAATLEAAGVAMPGLESHAAAAWIELDRDGPSTEVRRRVVRIVEAARRVRPHLPPAVALRLDSVVQRAEMPSDRQMEIARSAASGASSRAIADRLVLSVRTVDNHLAAVYRKLGVGGRDELAALLDR